MTWINCILFTTCDKLLNDKLNVIKLNLAEVSSTFQAKQLLFILFIKKSGKSVEQTQPSRALCKVKFPISQSQHSTEFILNALNTTACCFEQHIVLKVQPSTNAPFNITECPICSDKRPMDSLYCTVHFGMSLGYKCLALLPWQPMPPSQCAHFSVSSSSGFCAGNRESSAFIQETSVSLYLKWVFD